MSSHSFTRQELYDLVWSEPMVKLADRYGISGNGLAKACHRADIPVPERGYWAKQQAGHKVRKTPLPPTQAGTPSRITIRPPGKRLPPPEPPPVPASVQDKIDNERKSGKPVTVPATLSSPHRIIAGWLESDRRTRRENRYEPWLRSLHTPVDGTVLDKRRLRILSALFKALEGRGYQLNVDEYPRRVVHVASGADKLEVHLDERIQQVRRPLSEEEKIDRGYLSTGRRWSQERVPTGELILKIKEPSGYGVSKEWRETQDTLVDVRLGDVLAELAGMFEKLRLRRKRQAEEQERQFKIAEERRRLEMERKRETIRYQRLLARCTDWQTARSIRAFVAAIEASPLSSEHAERFAVWKNWSLGHADRIDPLRSDDLFAQEVSDHDVYMLRD